MLNILIVDDSKSKLENVLDVLKPYTTKLTVITCGSVIAAKRLLTDNRYDLVILDIQLPLRDGGTPIKDGGLGLLRELHTRPNFQKPHCIVGLTEFDDILRNAMPSFDSELWSIVLFSHSTDEWAERLSRKLEYLIEMKTHIDDRGAVTFDLGIVTAIQIELESVLSLGAWVEERPPGESGRFFTTTFSAGGKNLRVVATCAPQMGMPASAVATTKLISNFHPRYLAMVGICGGVRGEISLGDIVIADPCWDWGNGKRRIGEDKKVILDPDPLPERLHPKIRALFLDVQMDKEMLRQTKMACPGEKPNSELSVHIGPCVSGASVLADGQTVLDIKDHSRKLLGVDMEAYGVMYAAANAPEPRPFTFSMKSVCDFADQKKDDSIQKYSAQVSATLLQRIALKYF